MTGSTSTPPDRAGAADALALDAPLPELAVLHEAYCLPTLRARDLSREELWSLLEAITDESPDIEIEEAPPRSLTFGAGPTRVLLWSRGGVEDASHTMALADLFAYWRREPEDPQVAKLRAALTVVAAPMVDTDTVAGTLPPALYGRVRPHFVLGPRSFDAEPSPEGDDGEERIPRQAAFVATLTALEAIADGSYADGSEAYSPLQDDEAPAR